MKKKNLFRVCAVFTFAILIASIVVISCTKTEPGKDLATCGTCNWYGTNYPVCCNTTSGWGWENNASCISAATCTGSGQTCTGCNGGGGGCTATPIVPYIQVNGGTWNQTASASVSSGQTVIFGPQPISGGSWSWSGLGTSGTAREQTIHPTSSGTATATYTNSCGAKTTQNFTITIGSNPPPPSSGGGFKISGTSLKDANGNTFVMKGLAVPLSWFVSDVNSNIANIKRVTNANTLRIVMNTSTSDGDWQTCVQNCINNKIIAELELHDVTCSDDANGLNNMAQWWVSKASYLNSHSKYILINIANEWGSWNMAKNNPASWSSAYKTAISTMRNGGLNQTLVIDAPDCGQDLSNGATLRSYAGGLESYDPQHNILFTVHIYGEWESGGGSSISSGLAAIKNAGIPVIPGEFSYDCDYNGVINTCNSLGIGYMCWSWKGNSNASFDMSNDWAGTSLKSWGSSVVNGIKTASQCSVF